MYLLMEEGIEDISCNREHFESFTNYGMQEIRLGLKATL